MLAAFTLALLLQADEKPLISTEARLLSASGDLHLLLDKDAKPWTPWDDVKPAPEVGEVVAELLKRLEADDVAVRDDAAREVEELGRPILPRLKRALDGASPDLRARITAIALKLSPRPAIAIRVSRIPAEALAAFDAAIKGDKAISLVTAPKLVTFSGQKGSISVADQVAYIQDYEVRIPGDGKPAAVDPVINVALVGQALSFTATATADRTGANLADLTLELSDRLGASLAIDGPVGRIEDPQVRTQKYVVPLLTLKGGESALIGPLPRPAAKPDEAKVWLVVRAGLKK